MADEIQDGGEDKQYTSERLWTPYGEPVRESRTRGEEPGEAPPSDEPDDEEIRQRMEEAMEKVTVAEVVLEVLISLAGLTYRLRGVPYELSAELYAPEQAELIDSCLDSLVKALEERIPAEARETPVKAIPAADLVLDMMVSLSSLAYRKMGIPPEVNERFKDAEQAKLAIDVIGALLGALQGRAPEEKLAPFQSTLDNLKLNFAREF
ncbi:MAG: hypothetical protein KKF41_06865 [Actinobacteria bacterium]|nr:hypothetical protein [Actinomycetota bacterium]MBU1942956.1 hypothetical protein [Actinomycetota bacterium]MBU2687288.1 hypothetical protein [Actinomycetota bacterium]